MSRRLGNDARMDGATRRPDGPSPMPFTSLAFPAFFLIFFVVHSTIHRDLRKPWVLAASCFFYAVVVPRYLVVLLALVLLDFAAGILLQKTSGRSRTAILVASLTTSCGTLLALRLAPTLGMAGATRPAWPTSLVLPLGISFHVLQSMAYVVEVYRRRRRAERSLLHYALYALYWPRLFAGPVERPGDLLPQLHHRERPFDADAAVVGLRLLLVGFLKKLVLADRLAVYVGDAYGDPATHSGASLLLATYFFSIQIYCDLSAYNDIARGCARLMGVTLTRNFDAPYFATSLSDFWRRWHVSVSSWVRDYIYVPLGGSRVSRARGSLNVLIAFLAGAAWHGMGWTFVAWGALHGGIVVVERAVREKWRSRGSRAPVGPLVAGLATFHLVTFAWIFFRAASLHDALLVIGRIGTLAAGASGRWALGLSPAQLALRAALIAALFGAEAIGRGSRWPDVFQEAPRWARWCLYYASLAAALLLGLFNGARLNFFGY